MSPTQLATAAKPEPSSRNSGDVSKPDAMASSRRSATIATGARAEQKPSYADKARRRADVSEDLNDAVDLTIANIELALHQRERELKAQTSKVSELEQNLAELEKNIRGREEKYEKDKTRVESLGQLLNNVIENIIKPYTKASDIHCPDRFNSTSLMDMMKSLLRDAVEARPLRTQVQALQDETLAKVQKVQAISDDTLARDFRIIVSLVKSLSRTAQLTNGQDMLATLRASYLLYGVGPHQLSNRTQKKLYVEAWIWCALVHWVFSSAFGLFGEEGKDYHKMFQKMFGAQLLHGWPSPIPQSETWRYTTVSHLADCLRPEVTTSWENKPEYDCLEFSVVKNRIFALQMIENDLSYFLPTVDLVPIRQIIDKAFALALQMHRQRCRLMVTYPLVGEAFDSDSMTSVPNADGEEVDNGKIAFVINPGLVKFGDAHGNKLDKRYDIVPSLVQLESTDL